MWCKIQCDRNQLATSTSGSGWTRGPLGPHSSFPPPAIVANVSLSFRLGQEARTVGSLWALPCCGANVFSFYRQKIAERLNHSRHSSDATNGGSRRARNENPACARILTRETRSRSARAPGKVTATVTTTTQPHSLTDTPRSACHTCKKPLQKCPKRSAEAHWHCAAADADPARRLFPCRLPGRRRHHHHAPGELETDGSRGRGVPRRAARAGPSRQQAAHAAVCRRSRPVGGSKKAARRVARGRGATPGAIPTMRRGRGAGGWGRGATPGAIPGRGRRGAGGNPMSSCRRSLPRWLVTLPQASIANSRSDIRTAI